MTEHQTTLRLKEDTPSPAGNDHSIKLQINGQVYPLDVPANAILLDVVRERLDRKSVVRERV